jgi:alpha-D-ribose 1-methylphosphonate 5-triphosphate synthase subunit PhnH
MLLLRHASPVGFDPVHDSQAVFRALLDAMARPGTVVPLPARAQDAPIEAWGAAILLTLCDHDTRLAVALEAGSADLLRYIQQRVATPAVPPEEADILLTAASVCTPELLLRLPRGTLGFPDQSALAILLVDALGLGPLRLGLEGPGCPPGVTLAIQGCPWSLLAARAAAVAGYPCGIDLLFVDAAGQVAALPRSTTVTRLTEGER